MLSNTHVLCFVLGYQGGTVHQVAHELGVTTNDIIDADADRMGELCRMAQKLFWQRGGISALLLKHLQVCIAHLKADYQEKPLPAWLERADGVAKIVAESYPAEPFLPSS